MLDTSNNLETHKLSNNNNSENIDYSIEDTINKNEKLLKENNNEKLESCVEDLFAKLHSQFNDSQSILKTLANNLKILHKEVHKEKRELLKNFKNNKNNKNKNGKNGFAKPTRISEKLANFIGISKDELIPRKDATKKILDYIKQNNLQNPDNKRQIIPDQKLKLLLEPHFTENDKLEYFNIQKYLKYHFIKSEEQ